MTIQEAVQFVRDHATSILLDGSNGIIGLAVGSKDDGPVRGAKDFAVTAFVPKKLTDSGLARAKLQRFESVFAASAQHGRRRQRTSTWSRPARRSPCSPASTLA